MKVSKDKDAVELTNRRELYAVWRALDLAVETGYPHIDDWDDNDNRIVIPDVKEDVEIWNRMEKLRDKIAKKLER